MEVAAKIVHTNQACISVYSRVNMVIINDGSSCKDLYASQVGISV